LVEIDAIDGKSNQLRWKDVRGLLGNTLRERIEK